MDLAACRYIVIEGPIGAGKTSLARELAHRLHADELLEQPDDNPFLARFYDDMARFALPTQLTFLFQRVDQLRGLAQLDLFRRPTVADFLLDKDPLFARINLSDDEYALYDKVFAHLKPQTPTPDLVVYLQAPVDTLIERVHRRGIGFEQSMPAEYLARLADAYTRFFYQYEEAPLLIVNSERLNFVDDAAHVELLLGRVSQHARAARVLQPRSGMIAHAESRDGRSTMDLIESAEALRERLERADRVAFVPTMGNLHEGHLSLMRIARRHARCVVASIFVNRLQFGPNEDFDRYPRTFESRLRQAGARRRRRAVRAARARHVSDAAGLSRAAAAGRATSSMAHSGRDSSTACARSCSSSSICVQPDYAVFGKKDCQQLKLVRGMVQQFNLPIQIVPGETVRADDGLALSSRNNYLTPVERTEAPRLYRSLREIADAIASGRTDYANLEAAGRADLARHGWKVDYIAVRNGIGLRIPHPEGFDHPNLLIVLGAATLGSTRLIDNVDVIRQDGVD